MQSRRGDAAKLAEQDELDGTTVELQLNEFTDEDEVEERPEEDTSDDATGEDEPDEPAGQPPKDGPAEASPPVESAEEETAGFEESEEWLAPADVASRNECDEEEPYYEYAEQYMDPLAGYHWVENEMV